MIVEDVEAMTPMRRSPASTPGFKARIVKITTSNGVFHTPARILTRSEHKARSEAVISRALPPDLAMDFRPLDQKGVRELVRDGGAAEKAIRDTRQFSSCTRRAALRISVAQPPKVSLKTMSTEEKMRFADAQAGLFRTTLGAEAIAYPYIGLGASEYARFITTRSRRDETCTTLFTLSTGMDRSSLDKVLAHLQRDHRPAIVLLIHENPRKTAAQHRILARYMRDEKMAFLACQVPRIDLDGDPTISNLHTASVRHGYDMVALKQYPPAPGERPLDLDRIKLYSRDGLRIDTVQNTLAQRGAALVDEFHLNENNERDRTYIAGMLNTLDKAAADRGRFRRLEALAKVHEAINSTLEFARMRDMVSSGLLGEYLSQTVVGHAHMPPLPDSAQTLMTDYVAA